MSNVTVQEALKAAIKAIESGYELTSAKWKCKAALSEIEKCEPELYMAKNLHSKSYATSRSEAEARLFLLQSGLKVDGIESEVIPLCRCNTSPQPRDWAKLTDEQAYKCISDNATTSQLDLVRDVESACKQLNTKG